MSQHMTMPQVSSLEAAAHYDEAPEAHVTSFQVHIGVSLLHLVLCIEVVVLAAVVGHHHRARSRRPRGRFGSTSRLEKIEWVSSKHTSKKKSRQEHVKRARTRSSSLVSEVAGACAMMRRCGGVIGCDKHPSKLVISGCANGTQATTFGVRLSPAIALAEPQSTYKGVLHCMCSTFILFLFGQSTTLPPT